MDIEVIEDDDDINLESFGNELDDPPGFRDKNHPIQVKDEEDEDEDDDNDFNFLHDKWGLCYQMNLKT